MTNANTHDFVPNRHAPSVCGVPMSQSRLCGKHEHDLIHTPNGGTTIDLTPSWSGLVDAIVAVITAHDLMDKSGAEAALDARGQLRVMARAADKYNERATRERDRRWFEGFLDLENHEVMITVAIEDDAPDAALPPLKRILIEIPALTPEMAHGVMSVLSPEFAQEVS